MFQTGILQFFTSILQFLTSIQHDAGGVVDAGGAVCFERVLPDPGSATGPGSA